MVLKIEIFPFYNDPSKLAVTNFFLQFYRTSRLHDENIGIFSNFCINIQQLRIFLSISNAAHCGVKYITCNIGKHATVTATCMYLISSQPRQYENTRHRMKSRTSFLRDPPVPLTSPERSVAIIARSLIPCSKWSGPKRVINPRPS